MYDHLNSFIRNFIPKTENTTRTSTLLIPIKYFNRDNRPWNTERNEDRLEKKKRKILLLYTA